MSAVMFLDPLECYEAIGHAISDAVDEPWDEIRVVAGFDGGVVDLLVTYTPEGETHAIGNIGYVPMLADYFQDLARLVSRDHQGGYRSCRFVLHNSGRFNVNFGY